MPGFYDMTDADARAFARKRLSVFGGGDTSAIVDDDARIVRLDDPDARGVAVEAWVYLMDEESEGSRSTDGATNGADGGDA